MDVLTPLDLRDVLAAHAAAPRAVATLVTSSRSSTRGLLFDDLGLLGRVDDVRGVDDRRRAPSGAVERRAFQGISVVAREMLERLGPPRVASITEAWLAEEVEGFEPFGRWYVGRPLLVTENNYELKLYNGDTGIVIQRPDGSLAAAFERGDEIVELSPTQLEAVETVYAMTIHKSQGSQFEAVSVLLPPESSRITSRELLYTAATRTRERLTLIASADAIRAASEHPVARASGLRWRLD